LEKIWESLVGLGIFLILGFLAIAGLLLIYKLLRPKPIPEPQKYEPYESGEVPLDEAKKKYFIRFFPIALMFILLTLRSPSFYPGWSPTRFIP